MKRETGSDKRNKITQGEDCFGNRAPEYQPQTL